MDTIGIPMKIGSLDPFCCSRSCAMRIHEYVLYQKVVFRVDFFAARLHCFRLPDQHVFERYSGYVDIGGRISG